MTEKDYEFALQEIETFMHNENKTPEEGEYFELLITLIEKYEDEKYPIQTSSGLDVLKSLMQENNLKQKDLQNIIGSKGVLSEIINGKREISKTNAEKLGEHFGLNYKVFL